MGPTYRCRLPLVVFKPDSVSLRTPSPPNFHAEALINSSPIPAPSPHQALEQAPPPIEPARAATTLSIALSLSFAISPHRYLQRRRLPSRAMCRLHPFIAAVVCRGEFAVFPSFVPYRFRVQPWPVPPNQRTLAMHSCRQPWKPLCRLSSSAGNLSLPP